MGRYTGPTERLSRRAGVELELKGERRMARKSGLDRRAQPARRARRSLRPAPVDLRHPARRQAGRQALLRRARAPVPPLRARGPARDRRAAPASGCCSCSSCAWTTCSRGSASPPPAPRRASSSCTGTSRSTAGAATSRRAGSPPATSSRSGPTARSAPAAELATELTERVAPWLLADHGRRWSAACVREPARGEIQAPVEEQLIVEFYSRV